MSGRPAQRGGCLRRQSSSIGSSKLRIRARRSSRVILATRASRISFSFPGSWVSQRRDRGSRCWPRRHPRVLAIDEFDQPADRLPRLGRAPSPHRTRRSAPMDSATGGRVSPAVPSRAASGPIGAPGRTLSPTGGLNVVDGRSAATISCPRAPVEIISRRGAPGSKDRQAGRSSAQRYTRSGRLIIWPDCRRKPVNRRRHKQ
jgi:hypothetical protein